MCSIREVQKEALTRNKWEKGWNVSDWELIIGGMRDKACTGVDQKYPGVLLTNYTRAVRHVLSDQSHLVDVL